MPWIALELVPLDDQHRRHTVVAGAQFLQDAPCLCRVLDSVDQDGGRVEPHDMVERSERQRLELEVGKEVTQRGQSHGGGAIRQQRQEGHGVSTTASGNGRTPRYRVRIGAGRLDLR